MFARSYMDALNLEDFLVEGRPRIPKIMNVPTRVLSDFDDYEDEDDGSNVVKPKRIIVANQLPIRSYRADDNKWRFELDSDSLVFPLRDAFGAGVEVVFVGCLAAEIENPDEQDEVEKLLLQEFNCVPVFLSAETKQKFYHGFCKHYLWPLIHSMLPMTHGVRFSRDHWAAYLLANNAFVQKVVQEIDPAVDYVWIHDYHLMAMPTFLRKRYNRIKLGFFLHSPFPSSEIYRTLPVGEDILRALLNCDLIGFHTFDYARHFLSCCSRMLGLDYKSKRGYIGLEYYGRTVSIKIQPNGVHMGQLDSVLSMPSTAQMVKELKNKYKGKTVMVGVDDMDVFKGIGLKFLAIRDLLEKRPEWREKLVFVQITNPARSPGKDVQEVIAETNMIAEDINQRFGKEKIGYKPIVCINGPVTTQEKVAYYAISDCCVVNAVRDGMNLVPYKYTVSRQSNPVLDRALGIQESGRRESVIIVSEFIGCSPSLSGAIRVNPWNVDDVCNAMLSALTMNVEEKRLRHEKHYKYISTHDVRYWARSFHQDLERACKEHYNWRCWNVGLGLGFRIVALGADFRKLLLDHIVHDYREVKSRLILLDYDGTVMPQGSMDKTPSSQVMSILDRLSSDPKNIVFIVSGRGKDCLSKWLSPCKKLGIAAEHGYYTRWTADSSWERSSHVMDLDLDWMKIAEPVMRVYTETTDGSFIEKKESALVWHRLDADPDFGSCQAKELLNHLESVLANEPVVVRRGQHIVEVKPQGVSKGMVVENLISRMRSEGKSPDFILCIGDDRSDEDMFESIESSVSNPSFPAKPKVFACTVGQKPSMAQYYLDDSEDVRRMLEGLAKVSATKMLKE